VGFKLPIVRGPKLTKHSLISYIKSGIRILGCAFGVSPLFMPHATLLDVKYAAGSFAAAFLIAEIFGIAEEWGATY
jgi:hypothetical protein